MGPKGMSSTRMNAFHLLLQALESRKFEGKMEKVCLYSTFFYFHVTYHENIMSKCMDMRTSVTVINVCNPLDTDLLMRTWICICQ